MKNNFLKFGLLSFFILAYALPALAQPGSGGGGIDDDGEYDPAPIDNWILMLILAGVAVGVYFIAKYNKKAIA